MREGKVLTPFGFKPVSDIAVGDSVCNPDGTVAKVVGVFDRPSMPFYKLTFIDGASVEVDEDHIWPVCYAGRRKRRKAGVPFVPDGMLPSDEWNLRYYSRYKLTTTKQLAARMAKEEGKFEDGDRPNWPLIPLAAPCCMTASPGKWQMPPPYLYGVLIGDGCMTTMPVKWSKPDDQIAVEVRKEIEAYGLPWTVSGPKTYGDDCPRYEVRGDGDNSPATLFGRVGLLGKRSWEKHIASYYLNAPLEVRQELLRGLMDTDGYADDRGHIEYCTTSPQLAKDVQYLARSLGFAVTMRSKETHYTIDGVQTPCREAWLLYIKGCDTHSLFKLDRKRDRCKPYNGGDVSPGRRLISIERVEDSESRCIAIDHPNRLFITNDFIVTHNTDLALGIAATQHYRSLILRRESTQLRGIIDRSRELFTGIGTFNENTGVWKLNDGRQIELGGCKDKGDEEKYRGRPHDLKVYDEADQFDQYQFKFINGWLRTARPNQRCRILLTFNPPKTQDGAWLLDYFNPWLAALFPDSFHHDNPALPGELRWYVQTEDGEKEVASSAPVQVNGQTILPQSRTFIPAKVTDNPALMNTGYTRTLMALPEPLRSQLLRGDFTLGRSDDPWQVIPTKWIELAQKRWKPSPPVGYKISCLGADIARGGDDQTMLSPRFRNWFAPLERHPGATTPNGQTAAALIGKVAMKYDPRVPINIDVIGYGSSAYDLCRLNKLNAYPINFSEKTERKDKSGQMQFRNVRAYAYWSLREALDPDTGDDLMLPPDPQLKEDLVAQKWFLSAQGIQIIPKEEIAKKLKRSPDAGDAVALSHLQSLALEIGMPSASERESQDRVLNKKW